MMESTITIRFLAPFAGKDNWKLEVPVSPKESLLSVLGRLEQRLYLELKEKILDPPYPRFVIAINDAILTKEKLQKVQLNGNEQIKILALLVGG